MEVRVTIQANGTDGMQAGISPRLDIQYIQQFIPLSNINEIKQTKHCKNNKYETNKNHGPNNNCIAICGIARSTSQSQENKKKLIWSKVNIEEVTARRTYASKPNVEKKRM